MKSLSIITNYDNNTVSITWGKKKKMVSLVDFAKVVIKHLETNCSMLELLGLKNAKKD